MLVACAQLATESDAVCQLPYLRPLDSRSIWLSQVSVFLALLFWFVLGWLFD